MRQCTAAWAHLLCLPVFLVDKACNLAQRSDGLKVSAEPQDVTSLPRNETTGIERQGGEKRKTITGRNLKDGCRVDSVQCLSADAVNGHQEEPGKAAELSSLG